MTFLFDLFLFDQVAAIVKPRRRRRLTKEHKAKLAEVSAPYRYGSQGQPMAQESLPTPQGDPTPRLDCRKGLERHGLTLARCHTPRLSA
jgi:hypothetical protein